ncbi:nucleotidyltransferase domain-containing protein [Devosia nitrariae]|nr:nucleotidyltransferase domain-containing protein [Devosia nitrariae]
MQAAISERLERDTRIEALFLGGSFGRGAGDRFSDIDLVAVVPPEHQEGGSVDWKALLGAMSPVVSWHEFPRPALITNAVTRDWQRIDLMVVDGHALQVRSRDSLKPLFDRPGLYANLPETRTWPGPSKARVEGLIKEFIRIFGLLPVAVGRGEFLLRQAGVGLLRGMLADLLREEVERADKGGMLNWTKLYSPEQLALIASVSAPQPTREALSRLISPAPARSFPMPGDWLNASTSRGRKTSRMPHGVISSASWASPSLPTYLRREEPVAAEAVARIA